MPPLFLCWLPCRVTGIAGRLLFSLQQRISFCLFGRFATARAASAAACAAISACFEDLQSQESPG